MRVPRLLAILATLFASLAHAQDRPLDRTEALKAAYLFNFLKFVELPSASTTIGVCFVGARDVYDALTHSTENKKLGSRAIVTMELTADASWSGCDVVYLDATADVRTLLANAAGTSALTVGEADDFTAGGGIIRLFTQDNRLRFDINVVNARRAGVKISVSLLRLASHVEQ